MNWTSSTFYTFTRIDVIQMITIVDLGRKMKIRTNNKVGLHNWPNTKTNAALGNLLYRLTYK